MTITLLDTGPLVAGANRKDKHHASCARLLRNLVGRVLVPTTVLAEAGWILNGRLGPEVHASFLESVEQSFELVELFPVDLRRMADLIRQYKSADLDTVDVSVMAIAERLGVRQIATLDRRDFGLVRPCHIPAFDLLPETLP
ncbi:PIN domain-containing protein [Herbidospora sp. NEAU-GS84]|uniref:PIN domain-containing protein n=1 Tax=Herbidospora solisilvae TaxID=2696284 RepID=A0A7C9J5Q2_9ACTN|nr:PIN domain-containing protein [Herbidospora solisilvae]NAS25326.1 PIN domain-containing protein [Herbidospora solisilvae]